MKRIRPVPVSWPDYFWTRAESSYAGNDLECRGGCPGTGLISSRRVCPRCRGSGLLVPRRTPARPGDLTPGEPAWIAVGSDQLHWPLPRVWAVSLVFVPGALDLYFSDNSVLAFMNCGRLVLALFRVDEAKRHLEAGYRMAAGAGATMPGFVV